MKNKQLRWYVVRDSEDLWYVVSAYSHSRAKIEVLCNYTWYYDSFDALSCRSNVVKQKLSVKPKKEWEIYPDEKRQELLDVWLFANWEE